jgi:hypothetical protein
MQKQCRQQKVKVEEKAQTWRPNILFFYTVFMRDKPRMTPHKQEPLPTMTVGGVRWLTPPIRSAGG